MEILQVARRLQIVMNSPPGRPQAPLAGLYTYFYTMRNVMLLLLASYAWSQSPTAIVRSCTDCLVHVDGYGNQYFIDGKTLYKETGTASYMHASLEYGRPTQLIPTNTLQLALYYDQAQVLVYLDNKLVPIREVNLNVLGRGDAYSHVGLAAQQQIWLYNSTQNRLELYDWRQDLITFSSAPIWHEVRSMLTNYNTARLLTPDGILQFNVYGTQLVTLPLPSSETDYTLLPGAAPGMMDGTRVWLYQGNKWSQIYSGTEPIKRAMLTGSTLYIYDSRGLTAHPFKT